MTITETQWRQLLAEAKHRLGLEPVTAVLSFAAEKWGWPIPQKARPAVVAALALACQAREIEFKKPN